jgi:GNAT superfamily N-acetyltransferase
MPDTSRTPVAVIPLEEAHLPSAVEVHLRAFPGFFLSFLGPRFLRLFYGSFLEDEAGIGFTAMDNENRLLGVVVGPLSPEGYFKRLIKRRWWAFFLASLTAIIKKPSTIRRLFRALFYRGEAPESDRPRSLLSSIAVSPDAQGLGVGGSLVRAWCEEAEQRGSTGAFLTTDADDNEAVNRFYQKLGWEIETTFVTPEGRRMNRYIIDFDPPSAESSSPS